MNMIKKRQVNNLNYSVLNEVKYINQLFSIAHIPNSGIFVQINYTDMSF